MTPSTQLIVQDLATPCRVDLFLHHHFPEHSRTYFQYLIEHHHVKVNGLSVKKRHPLSLGDKIEITFQQREESTLTPQEIPLEILYEDEALLVINKPKGLVVHPAPGHPSNTLVHGLLYRYQTLQSLHPLRPGIVHRLDKDTSGVLVIAKTTQALESLSLAFKQRLIHKEYLALCMGNPGHKTLQNKLGRDPIHRQKMAIVAEGKEAISSLHTLQYHQGYSLVKIVPLTGRTHQIRVHLQSIGCPILGDPLYGYPNTNRQLGLTSQMLHAHILRFKHPFSGEEMTFEAREPSEMEMLKKRLF